MTRYLKIAAVVLVQALAEQLGWPAMAGGQAGATHGYSGPMGSNTLPGGVPARTAEEELHAQLAILQLVNYLNAATYCMLANESVP